MARKKTNNQVGRPHIPIDKNQFESLCNLQCTLEEIAGFFKCCDDTINNWCKATYGDNFSGVYKIYSQNGKISLRREQWKCAQKGNPNMLKWLGKQWLGQTEKIEQTTSFESFETLAELLRKKEK